MSDEAERISMELAAALPLSGEERSELDRLRAAEEERRTQIARALHLASHDSLESPVQPSGEPRATLPPHEERGELNRLRQAEAERQALIRAALHRAAHDTAEVPAVRVR